MLPEPHAEQRTCPFALALPSPRLSRHQRLACSPQGDARGRPHCRPAQPGGARDCAAHGVIAAACIVNHQLCRLQPQLAQSHPGWLSRIHQYHSTLWIRRVLDLTRCALPGELMPRCPVRAPYSDQRARQGMCALFVQLLVVLYSCRRSWRTHGSNRAAQAAVAWVLSCDVSQQQHSCQFAVCGSTSPSMQ